MKKQISTTLCIATGMVIMTMTWINSVVAFAPTRSTSSTSSLSPSFVSRRRNIITTTTTSRTTTTTTTTTLWSTIPSPSSEESSASSSSSSFDMMRELQQRINQEYSSSSDFHLPILEVTEKPERVYVVIIQPETMNQQAHTIEYPKGSGNNVILAFESYQACQKFADALIDQKFVDPEPLEFYTDELEAYFEQVGVTVRIVPKGIELKPPTQNVQQFGHDPSLRDTKKHLDYLFEMADEDLEDIGLLDNTSFYKIHDHDSDDGMDEDADSWQ